MPTKRPRRDWSIEEKIRILAEASTLTGAELAELLARDGVLQAEYEQWRLALSDEGRASLATTKRIRVLERELARKEKALAEAAALLVLKKKSKPWRRTRTPPRTRSTSHDAGRDRRGAAERGRRPSRLSGDWHICPNDSALETPARRRRPTVWAATPARQRPQRARANCGARTLDEC
jgi:putative transposase